MPPADRYDYIVIGSGAGGGPVAANLASAGFSVLLMEAGGDYDGLNYDVPAFHGQSTLDPAMRWDFWVRHYEDQDRQRADTKYREHEFDRDNLGHADGNPGERVDGILYPRASTIGGCTAHHALITVAPHESDWTNLQTRTGDESWAPENMRRYFERIEDCGYVDRPAPGQPNPARHGYGGWLSTEVADASLAIQDSQLLTLIAAAAVETLTTALRREPLLPLLAPVLLADRTAHKLARLEQLRTNPRQFIKEEIANGHDPNDYQVSVQRKEGLFLVVASTRKGMRCAVRERLRDVKLRFPGNLTIATHTLATKILFEGTKAISVEYLEGTKLFAAAPADGIEAEVAASRQGPRKVVYANREIIVAGGAFNTPQLLMLSGIGDEAQLRAHGIDVVANLPGVGQNLHDRYEATVVSDMAENFRTTADYPFRPPVDGDVPDRALEAWHENRSGVYATNGAIVSIILRSRPDLEEPDLFLFGLPAAFTGYYPGYANDLLKQRDRFTWAILKGHTKNRAGTVRLTSANPWDRPAISFRYFEEGSPGAEDDLDALVQGIKFVRELMDQPLLSRSITQREVQPGRQLDTDAELKDFVRREAWGHHACGTCKIGHDDDDSAVLTSDFRVRKTEHLRVVDASVFPDIPGFFIVTPIYMIAEKASEEILKAAGRPLPPVR